MREPGGPAHGVVRLWQPIPGDAAGCSYIHMLAAGRRARYQDSGEGRAVGDAARAMLVAPRAPMGPQAFSRPSGIGVCELLVRACRRLTVKGAHTRSGGTPNHQRPSSHLVAVQRACTFSLGDSAAPEESISVLLASVWESLLSSIGLNVPGTPAQQPKAGIFMLRFFLRGGGLQRTIAWC